MLDTAEDGFRMLGLTLTEVQSSRSLEKDVNANSTYMKLSANLSSSDCSLNSNVSINRVMLNSDSAGEPIVKDLQGL